MVLARQNWPASSITSRSRLPGGTRFGLAKSQAVPPITHPAVPVMNPAYSLLADLLPADVESRSDRFFADAQRIDTGVDRAAQQVLHHGVRLRDDADPPAVLGDQPFDDARAGEGLAGAGRPVHRHVGRVEVEQGGGDVVDDVAGAGELRAAAGPGRAAQQDVEHRGAGELRQPGRNGPRRRLIDSRSGVVGIGGPGVSANGSWSKGVAVLWVFAPTMITSVGALGSSTSSTSARPAARRSGLSVSPVGAGGS